MIGQSFQDAPALLVVEPSKALVKEFNRVCLLLGHDNRPPTIAAEILRAERSTSPKPVKARDANPRSHRECRWGCSMSNDLLENSAGMRAIEFLSGDVGAAAGSEFTQNTAPVHLCSWHDC